MTNKHLCIRCEKLVDYTVKFYRHAELLYKGKRVLVNDWYVCRCDNCGAQMSVLEYEKKNDEALKKAYEEAQ